MTTVPAVHAWPTNAHLVRDVARLGYITGDVVDLTFGQGNFWHLVDVKVVAHDIKGDGVDFTKLPEADETYDTVVFDPPYKLTGTPTPELQARYGLEAQVSWQERMSLIRQGATEGLRVCKVGGHLLVKCQDQVASGQVRWQTISLTNYLHLLGGRLVDRFDMLGTSRPQPADRRQVHAHGRPSTLLVVRKVYHDRTHS